MTIDATTLTADDFLGMVDHSILRPEVSRSEVVAEVKEVAALGTFSVCVKPVHVQVVAEALQGTGTLVGAVVGFPHGNTPFHVKVVEGLQAMRDGAVELDVVADFSEFREGSEAIKAEVQRTIEFARAMKTFNSDVVVKVILESAYFDSETLAEICSHYRGADVIDFVKTSTGFAPVGGATVEAVRVMAEHSGRPVKASGGVSSAADARAFVEAGATRLGCGKTALVVEDFNK